MRRRLPWWLWALVGAGSLVGIVALLGGFNEVPIEKLPQVQLGEPFVGNEVALQVDDIYLSAHRAGHPATTPTRARSTSWSRPPPRT